MNNRNARQSFLGPDSDRIFANIKVGTVGLGGGGSHTVQQLAHIGVGNQVVVDDDYVEESNLNRLIGTTWRDVRNRTPKVRVATRLIRGINPKTEICGIEAKWQSAALELRDCSIIFGCVDSFGEREQLERFARRFLIPYIDMGMDVHQVGGHHSISGQVVLSSPGSHCLRCLGILTDERIAAEAARYGSAGGKPQVVWPNGSLASAAIGIFIGLISPWHPRHRNSICLDLDGDIGSLVPSPRLEAIREFPCPHFRDCDIGDPYFTLGAINPSKKV